MARPSSPISVAENLAVGVPVIENAEHIAAAENATRDINSQYLTVITRGPFGQFREAVARSYALMHLLDRFRRCLDTVQP